MSPDIVGRLNPPRLSAAPSSPAVGSIYYDTGLNCLLYWNGTIWMRGVAVPPGSGAAAGSVPTADGAGGYAWTPGAVTVPPGSGAAAGSVPVANGTGGYTWQVPGPRSLWGSFSAAGAKLTGSAQVTCSRQAAGNYAIFFTPAFTVVPAIVVMNTATGAAIAVVSPTAASCSVITAGSIGGAGVDTSFDLIAIGT